MTIAAEKETKPFRWAGRALHWWLGELRGTAADLTRRIDLLRRGAIFIEAGERYWLLRQHGKPLGQIDQASLSPEKTSAALRRIVQGARRRGPIIVEIPQERVLSKRFALPAAAAGALERVLRYEIGRHFPFPADRVHFRHRVIAPAGGSDAALTVEVVAVPREAVAEIVSTIRAAGLKPRVLSLAGGLDGPLFLPPPAGAPKTELLPLERALLVSLAMLGAAAMVSPLLRDRTELAGLEREIAAIAPEVRTVQAAREVERHQAAQAALPLRLKAARPALVALLDGLTKAVPDGSWLLSLSVTGHVLVIDGLSPSAAGVALALEDSHLVSNVSFRSPISRDPQTGLERFELAASIPEAAP